MFWDRFITLCNKINKKPNPVAAELGISSGSITKWKNGGVPSDTNLKKIADYFGVSVECLKGKEELPTVNKKPPEIISNADIISDGKNIYMIPLFENVSAGFGAYADDHITDYIPMYFTNPNPATPVNQKSAYSSETHRNIRIFVFLFTNIASARITNRKSATATAHLRKNATRKCNTLTHTILCQYCVCDFFNFFIFFCKTP